MARAIASTCRSPPDKRANQLFAAFHPGYPEAADLLERDLLGFFEIEPAERPPAFGRLRAQKEIARDAHQGNCADVLMDGRYAAPCAPRAGSEWITLRPSIWISPDVGG